MTRKSGSSFFVLPCIRKELPVVDPAGRAGTLLQRAVYEVKLGYYVNIVLQG